MNSLTACRPGARRLVVIPAFNEADTVGGVVRAARMAAHADVLVINDGSTDATAQEARDAGARVLSPPVQLGAWGATQTGLRYAVRHGYRQVVSMDGDGQHDAANLPMLFAALDGVTADVVIGACEARLSPARRLAWGWFRLLSGLPVRDLTSGLRAYGPHAIEVLASARASLLEYQDLGVLMLATDHGLTLREVPATMSPRQSGVSRIFSSWPTVARYMVATSVLCLARMGKSRGRRTP